MAQHQKGVTTPWNNDDTAAALSPDGTTLCAQLGSRQAGCQSAGTATACVPGGGTRLEAADAATGRADWVISIPGGSQLLLSPS